MSDTEVAVAPETALATPKKFGKYRGAGRENITPDDLSLPFLQILQSLSKSVESGQHKAGEIYHSTSGETFDGGEGLTFIPAWVESEYVAWIPRKRGGGLAGRHKSSSPVVKEAKEKNLELNHAWNEFYANDHNDPDKRNELVQTGLIYGLIVRGNGSVSRVVIPCKVTHFKAFKNFNSMCADLPDEPPLFALRLKLKTQLETRTAGNSYNWDMSFDGDDFMMSEEDPLFLAGAKFYESLVAKEVEFDHAKTLEPVQSAPSAPVEDDDDSPF